MIFCGGGLLGRSVHRSKRKPRLKLRGFGLLSFNFPVQEGGPDDRSGKC